MIKMKSVLLAAVSLLAVLGMAGAQSNLEKLGSMKTTGGKGFTFVEQGGDRAAAISRTLSGIKLPEGFKISLYAIVPDARHMAVDPQGFAVFVGTRKTEAYAVTDRDKDRVADEAKTFA